MIHFHKYHGLGNDFILLESTPEPLEPSLVQYLCHRHLGIGADGILLVSPHTSADAQMIVYNADGSRPEMCGNGLRCVALHLASKLHSAPTTTQLTILTDAGPKDCLVYLDPPNPEALVLIDLGRVPPPQTQSISLPNLSLPILVTSVGNPHAIVFDPVHPFLELAPKISSHPDFPNGINVSFVTRSPDSFYVQVWERGVGPTLACGTAAAATAAAAIHAGFCAYDTPLSIQLPGGPLEVTISPSNQARLKGPAQLVFHGTLNPGR